MGQVAVTINGRSYEVACDDGQEDHLVRLASYIDKKMAELVTSVGQIGDTRLLVMSALLLADELSEAYSELTTLRGGDDEVPDGRMPDSPVNETLVTGIETLAQRVEDIAARLEGG
ncbi:MAG: cell division protein ZapA [Alphaproteobacteria bacterium]|nr:cell division protein ZapA [Pseudomonadota bacterium]MCZ6483159.1 cell division protein ZapA [Alphaproteobacteria bacterium]MCZ6744103.1 cell division protein ZapA [Alphaproteobacteria bacterium]TDI60168.1 MAG: cell division protein ZapA [Alphaproteobacteria bacterium]